MTERHANLLRRWLPQVLGVGTIVALATMVELLIRCELIDSYVMPLPSEVLIGLVRIVREEGAFVGFLSTVGQAFLAGALIVLIGVPIGFLLYQSRTFRATFESWVAAAAAAPLILAYPLFLVIFGRGTSTVVALGTASGLAPMILKTVEGLSGTRTVLVNVGRNLGLNRAQILRRILLPAALPTLFTGLRLGLVFALINIVGVQFLVNLGGLGQLINAMAERYDLPGTYAAIAFVVLVSMLFVLALEQIEQRLGGQRD